MGAARGVTPAGPDKVLRVEVPRGEFHMAWLQAARRFHGMRRGEMEVAARLLDRRRELSAASPPRAEPAVLAAAERRSIKEAIGISDSAFKTILSNLRRKGFLEGDRVSRRFVPEGRGDGHFRLMIDFVEHD